MFLSYKQAVSVYRRTAPKSQNPSPCSEILPGNICAVLSTAPWPDSVLVQAFVAPVTPVKLH